MREAAESSNSNAPPNCATKHGRCGPNSCNKFAGRTLLLRRMTAETNLALLKLQLLFHGIRAGKDLPSPLTNPFGLIHLALPEKVFVSVHLE